MAKTLFFTLVSPYRRDHSIDEDAVGAKYGGLMNMEVFPEFPDNSDE